MAQATAPILDSTKAAEAMAVKLTSAFGGAAELHGRMVSAALDANARISLGGGTRRPTATIATYLVHRKVTVIAATTTAAALAAKARQRPFRLSGRCGKSTALLSSCDASRGLMFAAALWPSCRPSR
jgi:hypothetical protein